MAVALQPKPELYTLVNGRKFRARHLIDFLKLPNDIQYMIFKATEHLDLRYRFSKRKWVKKPDARAIFLLLNKKCYQDYASFIYVNIKISITDPYSLLLKSTLEARNIWISNLRCLDYTVKEYNEPWFDVGEEIRTDVEEMTKILCDHEEFKNLEYFKLTHSHVHDLIEYRDYHDLWELSAPDAPGGPLGDMWKVADEAHYEAFSYIVEKVSKSGTFVEFVHIQGVKSAWKTGWEGYQIEELKIMFSKPEFADELAEL